jgi:hypothetical protein
MAADMPNQADACDVRIAADEAVADGWEPSGRLYPYFDTNIESMVVAHHGPDNELMVSVSPMLFNNRVLLSRRDAYPARWVAGFCYPKGVAASLAANAWDPLTQDYPVGFERLAGDEREPADLPSSQKTTHSK